MIGSDGRGALPDLDRPSTWMELNHASTARPLVVVVPERRLLAIHGAGSRAAADFRLATIVLRTVADLARKTLPPHRREGARPGLEVYWSIDPWLSVDEVVEALEKPVRRWTQMIELHRAVSDIGVVEGIDETRRQGGREVALVRLVHLTEGPSAQILHLSSDPEHVAIRKLYEFVEDSSLRPVGDLHELVLADPETVGRARGRSILRLPVADGQGRSPRPDGGLTSP